MIKIFLSTHGKMASGMKNSVSILIGKTDCLTVFDAYINDDPVEKHLDLFFKNLPDNCTCLLVSDIFGGSVNQVLSRYCERKNTFVITGINLALLISLVLSSDGELSKNQIENLVEESRQMTKLVSLDFDDKEENEEFF